MNKVDKLISYTQDIINGSCKNKHYNSVFFHSNENLNAIFNEVDVSGKDVLTVLSSGDQAFHLYDKGAKSVDFFDINNFTLYYFYLRVWTIKYLNQYYPNLYFKNNFLEKVLLHVKPSGDEEKIVYEYWKKFLWYFKDCSDYALEELFIVGYNRFRNKIFDLSKVKSRIDDEKYNFYNIDLSEEVHLDKKYDVIFVSNIGDRIRGIIYSDERNLCKLEIYKNNMLNLLKDDGIVICTNVVRKGGSKEESKVFSSDFSKTDLKEVCYECEKKSPGYVYKRVR